MKKSLYTEKEERYTEDALLLNDEAMKVIATLFKTYIDKGYKIRDIGHVIHNVVIDCELENVLGWNIKD